MSLVAVGRRVGRQVGGDQRQVEGTGQPEGGRHLDRPGPAGEAPGLLVVDRGRWAVPAAGSHLDLVEAAPGLHGQGGGQAPPGRRGVVDVVGGHERQPAGPVARVARASLRATSSGSPVAQLDGHVGRPELVDEAVELRRRRPPARRRKFGDEALAAAGEHQPVVVHLVPVDTRVVGPAFFTAGQLAGADGGGQAGVALTGPAPAGGRSGSASPFCGLQAAAKLGLEDRGHPHRPGRLGADHP